MRSETEAPRTDVYLLSAMTDANVKVRDGRLELKVLEERDAFGLERWRPVLKATLPIAAADLLVVCEAWGVPAPAVPRIAYTLDELEREIIAPNAALRSVPARKRRTRVTFDGCAGERVTLRIGRQRWSSLAIESADPAQLRDAVHRLGLGHLPNQNYPAALKRIAGVATPQPRL